MTPSKFSRWCAYAAATMVALGALLWTGKANAYCQEVTVNPPPNYDPATQGGCFTSDSEGGPPLPTLFWHNQCVEYSLQSDASAQISLSVASQVAAQAFTAWTGASCANGGPSIWVYEAPPVACSTVPSQLHNNPIIFRDGVWPYDDSVNALGFTKLTINTVTGEIYGADIEINSSKILVAQPPAPSGAYDLASILTHEAGHFLGLAHSADTTAVMYAFYHRGSTSLQLDDVAGICSLYPPNGTRETSSGSIPPTACDPTPIKGFSSSCDGSDDAGIVETDGAAFDADADAGDPAGSAPLCPSLFSCAAGGARFPSGSLLAAEFGILVLASIARRSRRAHAHRGPVRVGAIVVAIGASALGGSEARASVSIALSFEDLLQRSSAAAVVTPTEQRSLWEGDSIATYTHVRIDRIVSGELAGEVWVMTRGGRVGDIGQLVEGEATFMVGRPALVFLRPHVDSLTRAQTNALSVVERAQGQFPIEPNPQGRSRLALARNIGTLVSPSGASPSAGAPPLARDVLSGRTLDDAARTIALAWAKTHGSAAQGKP